MKIISKNGPIGLLQFQITEIWHIDPCWWYAQCDVIFENTLVGKHMVADSMHAYVPSSELVNIASQLRLLKFFLSEKALDELFNKRYTYKLVRNYVDWFYYPKLRGIYHNIAEEPSTLAIYLLDDDEVIRNFATLIKKKLT
jgi:hypothetical protein